MAKDLPYFKFNISEWNDGDITLCSMEAQGLFINLCSMYWSQEGELSLAKAKRRFSGCNAVAWESLIGDKIIKVRGDLISISFLDEQLKERGKLSVKNSENASKGWEKRKNNTSALPPQSDRIKVASNIEEKREEQKRKEENRGEERTLAWFEKFFDEIWKEQVAMTHPGKDVQQAIKEAFLHAGAGPRLATMDGPAAKRLVNTWLANMKSSNGQTEKKRAFEIKDGKVI